MILNTPRRADNNMRPMLQRTLLRPERLATTQQHQLDIGGTASQSAQLFTHLIGQLTRRAQDQCLHPKETWINLLQQTNSKSRCFTAACFCLGYQIPALQHMRQALRLDGRHFFITK